MWRLSKSFVQKKVKSSSLTRKPKKKPKPEQFVKNAKKEIEEQAINA